MQLQRGLPLVHLLKVNHVCLHAGSSGSGCHGQSWKAGFSCDQGRPPAVLQRVVHRKPGALSTVKPFQSVISETYNSRRKLFYFKSNILQVKSKSVPTKQGFRTPIIHSYCTDFVACWFFYVHFRNCSHFHWAVMVMFCFLNVVRLFIVLVVGA